MKYINLLFAFTSVLILFSCAKTTTIKALEPAEISQAAMLKRIAVLNFENDTVGLSSIIESKLSKRKFDDKPFFKLINRKNIGDVLKEQKLSDLMEESTSVKLGQLLGAEAIVSGEVMDTGLDNQSYKQSRSQCLVYNKKGLCDRYSYYSVNCAKRIITLSANLRIVDVEKGSVIYTEHYSVNDKSQSCTDRSSKLTSESEGLNRLSNKIASKFVYKLTPNYVTIKVTLLDDPQIDYNSAQSDLLDNSIKFIKANNLKKAKSLLEQLHKSTGGKSMVAAYNLGVVHESLGNYKEADVYYNIANELQKKPVKEVSKAVNRIKNLIEKDKKVQRQIKK